MTDESTAPADTGKRQDKRDSLYLTAQMSVAGGAPIDARVRNLSAGGMLVDITAPVAIDDLVAGDMRGVGAISGKIVWAADGRAGIAFDADIDPRRARTSTGAKTQLPAYFFNAPSKRPALRPLR